MLRCDRGVTWSDRGVPFLDFAGALIFKLLSDSPELLEVSELSNNCLLPL